MLADVQTWHNLSGRSLDALGHLVECVPWSLGSDACRRSDVGTTIRGGGALMRSASCRAVAVALLCSVLMLADVQTLAQPFGAVVL